MLTLILMRHAKNDYNDEGMLAGHIPGLHLNNEGKIQAELVAKRLAHIPLKAIYSSPLERAVETAESVAKYQDIKVVIRSGLKEVDYGDWQGKSLKNLRKSELWSIVQATPSKFCFPGGESFIEAQHRVIEEITGLISKHSSKDIIMCVSHADIIKLAIVHFLEIPFDTFQHLIISTASITTIIKSKFGFQLLNLNVDYSNPVLPQ